MRRITELSDAGALGRLMARARDHTLSHAKRIALMREINRRAWQYDPEYVARLRDALVELDGARAKAT